MAAAKINLSQRLLLMVSLLALQSIFIPALAQSDSLHPVNKARLRFVVIGSGVAYTGAMIGLSSVWYSQYDKEPFHFFNDFHEWKQMDKAGHFYSAFQVSSMGSRALQWSGVAPKKSDVAGALAGFAIISSIEILDGFSAGYGASASDLAFNALGAGFYLGQQAIWKEIRIHPKFSFHTTVYAPQRPEVLGSTLLEQVIKDYNGQTYWLSVDVDKFVTFPNWLNISVGYGAEDMLYALDEDNKANNLNPYRQFYIGLDFDVSHLRSRSKFANTLLYFVNMIKIPGPTLEFSKGKIKGHFLYF
jgi:uncharacterized protein YfiM (DUF2279 family)